ncbi:bifunctional hydroxymethylpyrimidine kinase/phosphomethylpyrimidine kinase [Altererythrobacter sp. KTW20L]|uniref:bifunctional hydroxymethylpyrimidine kinase/phosphomethylpyrimidine kinase n=1 Tax=Altererythrobacter sp. KTW20L TaxID=2942210 RepID=UPI0020BF9E1D|nr:bifunctional hydroxymethylpyrimidine kinase/phosphomethylpyrimidine kinase [Altererythrobacter sp. KTW20L]MCL6250810.1 bifunctional hydroxymethylpyrimidine kinase/phosphomethylpyrimidine kinase [Altererythrobacter sp. KTW20L]
MSARPPRILVIAGSDSSGGAGIQADIKTITMLGGYAMTAITAVTAQNTRGVTGVELLSPDMVAAQMDACMTDIGVDAVKIGMLGSADIAEVVADRLEDLPCPIVFDPVMVATSGSALADEATIGVFDWLMELATVTTPNLPELERLSGMRVVTEIDQAHAADKLLTRTQGRALLAKGGHWPGGEIRHSSGERESTDDLVFDFLYERTRDGFWSERSWSAGRIHTRHTHGTGCTLGSAIATLLAQGRALPEAIAEARLFVRRALEAAPGFGSGNGPMGHQAVR